MPNKVVTNLVRFSYLHVLKPYAYNAGDEEKYSVTLPIDKNDKKTIAKIKEAEKKAIEEGIATKWGGKRPDSMSLPLHDGDEKDAPEYQGKYYLNAKCDVNHAPGVFDADGEDILDPAEIRSGDYGRACVTLYPFNNRIKGVGVGLVSVKKIKDGEPLGGTYASASDYDDEDDDYGID